MKDILKTPLWTGREILTCLGLNQPSLETLSIEGLALDHRAVQPGDLFIARMGENQDGHDYMEAAFQKGAAAALGQRRPEGTTRQEIFVVPHTEKALEALASYGRRRCRGKIIAVTGSVGKTGVKEGLLQGLYNQGATVSSPKSYNNQVGVPYSLCFLREDTDFGIFEIGMNHRGEISPLSQLIRPQCAIITTVEPVHIENFSHLDEIAAEKSDIFMGLEKEGTAVLNRDNPYWSFLRDKALAQGAGDIFSFGVHEEADVRLLSLENSEEGTHISFTLRGKKITYEIPFRGVHHALNSLAVLAAIEAVGGDVQEAALSLRQLKPLSGRGNKVILPWAGGEILILDETYNANPLSVRGALQILKEMPLSSGGRRLAVLGDMLELGPYGPQWHADLSCFVDGIDQVVTCGSLMAHLSEKLSVSQRGFHGDSSQEVAHAIKRWIQPGDVIMIKGSRGMKMEKIIKVLEQKE